MTCARRRDVKEFCTECAEYPCQRYVAAGNRDSFVTYRRRDDDLARTRTGLNELLGELSARTRLLEHLIANHDDGRHRSFFCLACTLLPLDALRDAVGELASTGDPKTDARRAESSLREVANSAGIDLTLRR